MRNLENVRNRTALRRNCAATPRAPAGGEHQGEVVWLLALRSYALRTFLATLAPMTIRAGLGAAVLTSVLVVTTGCGDTTPRLEDQQAGQATAVPSPLPAVPEERLALLSRGANVRYWFADSRPDGSLDGRELDQVVQLGLRHLRLPFRLSSMLDPERPERPNRTVLATYKRAVSEVVAHGLGVVVSVFASEDERRAIASDARAADRFGRFWDGLARELAPIDPNRVFFEVLSEPIASPEEWSTTQAQLLAAMRRSAPANTLVAVSPLGTASYDAVESFARLLPSSDGNIVYSLHFYEPYQLAYAGLNDRSDGVEQLRDVPYPYDEARCQALVSRTPDGPGRSMAVRYCSERWDRGRIEARVARIAEWRQKQRAPVYVGEFGAWPAGMAPADRAQWFRDVRSALEAAGVGWSVWAYDDPQGLAVDGRQPADAALAQALGLRGERG